MVVLFSYEVKIQHHTSNIYCQKVRDVTWKEAKEEKPNQKLTRSR